MARSGRAVCPLCGRVVARARKVDLTRGYKMRRHNAEHGQPCAGEWSQVDYVPPSRRQDSR